MRNLIVKRKKSRAGGMIQYLLVVGGELDEYKEKFFRGEDKCKGEVYPITNGETLEIPIEHNKINMFVMAMTSTGKVFSEEVYIEEGDVDVKYEIITQYSLLKGSKYVIKKVEE